MLAAPGGLYLDVKSGYAKAQHLKWFASTLAGIGVNVKVGHILTFARTTLGSTLCYELLPSGLHNLSPLLLLFLQAICSFVPAQIDFASLKDTQPFGGMHSHQEAEAAAASGKPAGDKPPNEGAGAGGDGLVSTTALVTAGYVPATASAIISPGGSIAAASGPGGECGLLSA